MNFLAIDRLSRHSGGPVVAVIDFQPLGAARSLAVELSKDDYGFDIRRIDVVRDLSGSANFHELKDLAAGYTNLLTAGEPVACVVGYCSASVLATTIGYAVSKPVLLVAPTQPSVLQARQDFAGFLAKLGVDDVPDVGTGGTHTHKRMNAALEDALREMATQEQMDDDEVDTLRTELLRRFDGWLGFLLSAAASDLVTGEAEVVPVPGVDDAAVALVASRITAILGGASE